MTLRARILGSQLGGAAAAATLIAAAVLWQATKGFNTTIGQAQAALAANTEFNKKTAAEMAAQDLSHIVRGTYAMCEAQQELLQRSVESSLGAVRTVLKNAGTASLGKEPANWRAVGQMGNDIREVQLPRLLFGDAWLGQLADAKQSAPLADQLQQATKATWIVFQRINEDGDMLAVCTNAMKPDGSRMIGLLLPSRNPDGSPNALVEAALKGGVSQGRLSILNTWYVAACDAIRDADGKPVGMICAALKEQSSAALRKSIMSIVVGKTGYMFVLNGKGERHGAYVISKDGKRDGENIWETKDADGKMLIQDMCARGGGP